MKINLLEVKMLNNLRNILIGIFAAVIVVAIGASAYTAFASPGADKINLPEITMDFGQGNENGNGNAGEVTTQTGYGYGNGTSVLEVPASELSPEESASLLFMREEEKLACDVYHALFAIWGQPTFQNIAAGEQAHMDQVKLLLDRYSLADPALEPGVFSDPELQALYNTLVAHGSVSLADALKVGAAIEEIDIIDLEERLALTDNADIQQVFNNLMAGSYNHLDAFVGVLAAQTGEVYEPLYLSPESFDAIVTNHPGNGYSNSGQTAGQGGSGYRESQNGQSVVPSTTAGEPQVNADITGAYTITGTVSAYDLVTLTVSTYDGQSVIVQLGNATYSQSIGFAPQINQSVTVLGFPGDQGLFSAISVTIDGQVYTFRDELGRPLWAGGPGKGRGDSN